MPLENTVSVTALQTSSVAVEAAAPISFVGVAVNDNAEPGPSMVLLIGELRGELRGIKSTLDDMRGDIDHAAESRGQLHEKVNLIGTKVTALESTVNVMGGVVAKQTTRIDKIEPLALWLIAIAGGLLVVGGALWYGVMNYGSAVLDWLISLRRA